MNHPDDSAPKLGDAPAATAAGLDEPRLWTESGVPARVARTVEPILAEFGLRLVRVKFTSDSGASLQIMAERPDGTLSIEDCEVASKAISPVLDLDDPMPGKPYRLELSSPGIDRPLMRVSDFVRAIGQEAKIEMATAIDGRRRYKGIIESAAGDSFTLHLLDPRPEDPEAVSLAFADLEDARLVLTEALIREALKADRASAEDEDAPDGDASAAPEPAAEPKPARFAPRAAKPKPMTPAGIQTRKRR